MPPRRRAKPLGLLRISFITFCNIKPKRNRPIPAGSGTKVEDVNRLLRQYEMMQKLMKQMRKSPKGFARKLGGMLGGLR